MDVNFGESLRWLRVNRYLTQEQLAYELDVSPQTISRWETGGAYPDLTMLLTIADFFDVTLDELIDRKNKFSLEGKAEFDEKMSKLSLDESIDFIDETIKKYPNNDYLLFVLSNLFVTKKNRTKTTEYDKKIISLCEKINRVSKNIGYIVGARCTLAKMYVYADNREKAYEIALDLPGIFCSREFMLRFAAKDDEKLSHCQFNVLMLMDIVNSELKRIARITFGDSDKIKALEAANEIISLITGSDAGFYNLRLSENHIKIAEIFCTVKNEEETLSHLAQALSFAEKYESLPQSFGYDVPWLGGYDDCRRSIDEKGGAFGKIVRSVSDDRFDFIRDTQRYKAFEKRLRK